MERKGTTKEETIWREEGGMEGVEKGGESKKHTHTHTHTPLLVVMGGLNDLWRTNEHRRTALSLI